MSIVMTLAVAAMSLGFICAAVAGFTKPANRAIVLLGDSTILIAGTIVAARIIPEGRIQLATVVLLACGGLASLAVALRILLQQPEISRKA